jgi:uncharacterized membrane protein YbaN (DUF454 family)
MEQECELSNETGTRQKIIRAFFFGAGSVCLALGAIGIVLPVLPTTPFLLLALACYCRSSKRMTRWILTNKYFGDYIRRYKEGKGIPLKTKILALAILWITITYSAYFMLQKWLAVQLILFAVAITVTLHIVKLPTYRKTKH